MPKPCAPSTRLATSSMAEASLDPVVVDASVLVDVLAGTDLAEAARTALAGRGMQAPAHLDVEDLSALGRMQRAGHLSARYVSDRLRDCAAAPIDRMPLAGLLVGAWRRRADLRLTDALYVELAEQHGLQLLTTDRRLGRAYTAAHVIGD